MANNSLQIRCGTKKISADFKRDIADLAAACGYRDVSNFMYDILSEYVELNRDRIEKYRELVGIPLIKPKTIKARSLKKKPKEAAGDDSEA